MNRYFVGFLAIIGGGFLAGMIGLNADLASYTSPVIASWVAHGVGAIVALILIGVIELTRSQQALNSKNSPGTLLDNLGSKGKNENLIISSQSSKSPVVKAFRSKLSSKWMYLGGIPGAATVVLAAITVNSELGLTGTIVLSIVGQTVFGMACDHFGWFGLLKRPLNRTDLVTVILTVSGSFFVVMA